MQREEAAQALREAEAAAGRSTLATGYKRTSPFLFLWGAIWIVANLCGVAGAPNGGLIWAGLCTLGIFGSIYLGLRLGGTGKGTNGPSAWRSVAIAGAIFLFVMGMQVIRPTGSFIQYEAQICLAVGAVYMVMGITTEFRMFAVGLVLQLATIAIWIWGRDQFFLWMALVGGGGLVLGGLWLRRA